jgi:hypothetical protein
MTRDEHASALTHQASGMMAVQTRCTVADALIWMTSRANETGQTVNDIADAVLERRLRFTR